MSASKATYHHGDLRAVLRRQNPRPRLDWADRMVIADPATQIRWGLEYIQSTYGSPCAAWSHEEATGWY